MGAPQRQVIEALNEKVALVDEQFDGYHSELLAVIGDILTLEQERPHKVSQKIQNRITALGELLARKQGADS